MTVSAAEGTRDEVLHTIERFPGTHKRGIVKDLDSLARYEPVPSLLDDVHDTWDDLFGGHRG